MTGCKTADMRDSLLDVEIDESKRMVIPSVSKTPKIETIDFLQSNLGIESIDNTDTFLRNYICSTIINRNI